MKILVTGGAGFIGSNFVCSALQQGHELINIDKLTYAGNLDNLDSYQDHKHHHFYKQDICDVTALEEIIFNHQPDIVVHMAAESHVDRSIDSSAEFIRTNINGTHALLEAALKYYRQLKNKNSFRFIHLSTDEVFGALGKEGSFHEEMPYRPNSPYAASKAASDLLVRSYFKTHNLPAITINCSNNYGPKQYQEKLMPLIILHALEQKPLPIYGDGQQVRDWLFVEDHIDALFSIIEKGCVGESYCIGSNNEMTNLSLVHHICDILNDLKPVDKNYCDLVTFVKDRPAHDFRYATDSTKLHKDTGWVAKTAFIEGIKKTVKWYVEHFTSLEINAAARERIGLKNDN